jgi:hypothetical protein
MRSLDNGADTARRVDDHAVEALDLKETLPQPARLAVKIVRITSPKVAVPLPERTA